MNDPTNDSVSKQEMLELCEKKPMGRQGEAEFSLEEKPIDGWNLGGAGGLQMLKKLVDGQDSGEADALHSLLEKPAHRQNSGEAMGIESLSEKLIDGQNSDKTGGLQSLLETPVDWQNSCVAEGLQSLSEKPVDGQISAEDEGLQSASEKPVDGQSSGEAEAVQCLFAKPADDQNSGDAECLQSLLDKHADWRNSGEADGLESLSEKPVDKQTSMEAVGQQSLLEKPADEHNSGEAEVPQSFFEKPADERNSQLSAVVGSGNNSVLLETPAELNDKPPLAPEFSQHTIKAADTPLVLHDNDHIPTLENQMVKGSDIWDAANSKIQKENDVAGDQLQNGHILLTSVKGPFSKDNNSETPLKEEKVGDGYSTPTQDYKHSFTFDHFLDGEDSGTEEEQAAFMKELDTFYKERSIDFKPPKFYGEGLNCLKLWRGVTKLGGYEQVTSCKLWRQVGESFKPPKTCTTVSWTFRIFYEKALLEYEKHKIQTGKLQVHSTNLSEPIGLNDQAEQNQGSVSGRARRDAAARAMQGWHSQRFLGNGEVSDPIIKDKNLHSLLKKEKNVKSIGALKKRKASSMERTMKVARMDDAKAQEDVLVVDAGEPAEWVKINVRRTMDCFEVYALVPGLLREEVQVQSDPAGRLIISGEPEQPNNPWGVTPFKKVITLPSRIDPHQTSAVVTLHGQLFVRIPFEQVDL